MDWPTAFAIVGGAMSIPALLWVVAWKSVQDSKLIAKLRIETGEVWKTSDRWWR